MKARVKWVLDSPRKVFTRSSISAHRQLTWLLEMPDEEGPIT